MRTTFARTMTSAVILVVTALLALGITFEFLARDFFRRRAMEDLNTDAEVISALAAAY